MIFFGCNIAPKNVPVSYKKALRYIVKNKSASVLSVNNYRPQKSACKEAQGALVAKGFKGTQ